MKEKLVAHLRDGEIVKGYSQDFDGARDAFHLLNHEPEVTSSRRVDMSDLKAVFFVRSWGRAPGLVLRNYRFGVGGLRAEPGRRTMVKFRDGERIWGYMVPEATSRDGFYLVPADPEDNNLKIYVVRASLEELSYLDPASSTQH